MTELLSEVTGTSISGRRCPRRYSSRLNWLPAKQIGARLSGLSRSDFVLWPTVSKAAPRSLCTVLGELLPGLSTAGQSGSFECKFERDGDVALPEDRDPYDEFLMCFFDGR